ncbi:hypothetical protein ZIOFF_024655 [Zingiber officinale]|uniref:DAGKc domain-containing protein n=1 Tax=Zingiber officinale TaxID=94328 RepID=A0A8J5L6E0_ZINOF|nr:hypothetical protein ZIOFF_024655 [Zingiber officinale]
MERNGSAATSTLFLDRIGEVTVTMDPGGFSWKLIGPKKDLVWFMANIATVFHVGVAILRFPCENLYFAMDQFWASCLCMNLRLKSENRIEFANIYAVEFIGWGLLEDANGRAGSFLSGSKLEMYRFVVHGFQRGRTCGSPWTLCEYTFGHKDLRTCESWVQQLIAQTNIEAVRPKNLLVFVHPSCGKGHGVKTWEMVESMFSRANVQTKVTITQRARHAYDLIASLSDKELSSFDGIVAVGGDGLFNEVLNGLLSSRHDAPYPPSSEELNNACKKDQNVQCMNNGIMCSRPLCNGATNMLSTPSSGSDDHEPLLSAVGSITSNGGSHDRGLPADADTVKVSFPNDWFRLGLIPAGSTDSIVVSTTGTRDPVTSALQIILGKRISLDIAQVVRWKTSPSSKEVPSVHYAASFAGCLVESLTYSISFTYVQPNKAPLEYLVIARYGFYGDVIKGSEGYRWMGPKRYDYAGTMAFLKHRSYEAEIKFLKTEEDVVNKKGTQTSERFHENLKKVVCRANCNICNDTNDSADLDISNISSQDSRWLQYRGCFLSVGAAVISCRNERAPEGLVAEAHLSDGKLV